MSLRMRGHSASPGLAIGRAFWVVESPPDVPHRKIKPAGVRPELLRLSRSLASAVGDVQTIETQMTAKQPAVVKDLFAVHRLMLTDPVILSRIEEFIRGRRMCAEWSIEAAFNSISREFGRMKNKILASRRDDLKDVMRFLLDHLTAGPGARAINGGLRSKVPAAPFIAIADEISPAQTAALFPTRVVGMVTRLGGRTSHAAIIAREMGIPLVFGLAARSLYRIKPQDLLLVDGSAAQVTVNPSADGVRRFRRRVSMVRKFQKSELKGVDLPTRTADGADVLLRANIEMEEEAAMVKKYGACGVGLFRTEYLYLGNQVPDEEALYRAYRKVARAVAPGLLVVRTMDLGGDKFLSPIQVSHDLNPMLGLRAIRLCLAQPQLLMPQILAAFRANSAGTIRLCLPMISAVEEIQEVRKFLGNAARTLTRRRVPFRPAPLGIMVEVPSVAIRIDRFLPHADFFSIGTNDLVQYTLAVSRTLEQVANLYRPLNPSVLSLLHHVVRTCTEAGKPVSLCGEEAHNPLFVPFLMGIGLRDLSMAPSAILDIKRLIRGLSIETCGAIAKQMLEYATTHEVETYIRSEVYPMVKSIIPQHYSYISLESELR